MKEDAAATAVSMKSGLEDRNNEYVPAPMTVLEKVSMKSGLEDRNNELTKGVLDTQQTRKSQ